MSAEPKAEKVPDSWVRCPRCWKYRHPGSGDYVFPELCIRCGEAIEALFSLSGFRSRPAQMSAGEWIRRAVDYQVRMTPFRVRFFLWRAGEVLGRRIWKSAKTGIQLHRG